MGYQSLVLAIKNLLASKMRSFLTMLGVIIGVAAVFVIAGMGNGMKQYVKESFSGMGTNTLNVSIYGGQENKTMFELKDMEDYVNEHKDVFDGFSPDVNAYQVVKYKKNKSDVGINGVTEDYMKLNKLVIDKGRNISYVDIINKKRVCVVGAFYAKTWFGSDVIGKKIGINGSTFEIVGTIKQVTEKGLPEQYGPDSRILSPYTTVMEIGNIKEINKTGLSKEFDNFFDNIIYLNDSCFIDNVHLKQPENYTVIYEKAINNTEKNASNIILNANCLQ